MKRTHDDNMPIVPTKKRRRVELTQADIDAGSETDPAIAIAIRRATGAKQVRIYPTRIYIETIDRKLLRYMRPRQLKQPCMFWLEPVPIRHGTSKPRAAKPQAEAPPAPPLDQEEAADIPPDPPAPRPVPPRQIAMPLEPDGRTYQTVAGELLREHLAELFPIEVSFLGMMFNRERAPSARQLQRLRDLCHRCNVAPWRGARPQLQIVR